MPIWYENAAICRYFHVVMHNNVGENYIFKSKHKPEFKEALEVAECTYKLYPDKVHIEKIGPREGD